MELGVEVVQLIFDVSHCERAMVLQPLLEGVIFLLESFDQRALVNIVVFRVAVVMYSIVYMNGIFHAANCFDVGV